MKLHLFDNGPGLITQPRMAPLSAGTRRVPEYCDCMPYCMPASNQGQTSQCAWYTATCGAEARHWRIDDVFEQLESLPGYDEAKRRDGMPGTQGTTLTAATEAAVALGVLPPETHATVINSAEQVRYAIHRTGGCMLGFSINSAWKEPDGGGTVPDGVFSPWGGHAVWGCYYDPIFIGFANSWGADWGWNGFGRMTWAQFEKQFMYGVQWDGIPR